MLAPDDRRFVHAVAEDAIGIADGQLADFIADRCRGRSEAVGHAVEELLQRCRVTRLRMANRSLIAAQTTVKDWTELVNDAEMIGQGATGTVIKARQLFPNRWVAIKILHEELHADSEEAR